MKLLMIFSVLGSLAIFSGIDKPNYLSSHEQQEGYLYESEISDLKITFPGIPNPRITKGDDANIEAVSMTANRQRYEFRVSRIKDAERLNSNKTQSFVEMNVAEFLEDKEAKDVGKVIKPWKVKKYKGQMVSFYTSGYQYHYRVVVIGDLICQLTIRANTGAVSDFDEKKAMEFCKSLKLK